LVLKVDVLVFVLVLRALVLVLVLVLVLLVVMLPDTCDVWCIAVAIDFECVCLIVC